MSGSTGTMASLAVAALSGGLGLLSVVAYRRTLKTSNFRRITHSRVLFVCIIIWSIWKVVTAMVSAITKTSSFQATGMALSEIIGQATIFMVCYAAYLGCWADVHIHGHLHQEQYRYSRAPWVIMLVSASCALFSGFVAMIVNVCKFLPPYRTLEIWTTIMCVILVLSSIGLAFLLWRRYPPEQTHAKRISLNMQNTVLFFICLCFILRARMSWVSTSYLGVSSFQQMTRFVYLAAEWLAVGVMLIFTFPSSFDINTMLPNSEFIRVQWKRTKVATAAVGAFGVLTIIACAFVLSFLENRKAANYDVFFVLDITATSLSVASALFCGLLFVSCLKKHRASIRPLVICLIITAGTSGGYCFASAMCLIIGVPPFSEPSIALVVTTACCSCLTIAVFFVCSFGYRLSSYVRDSSFDILIDNLVLDENFETPNKELEDKAWTVQKFLLISLVLHTVWICIYFIPATSETLKSTLSYGWTVPLVTLVFVVARFPLALFGYVSSLFYRRDNNRLRGYVYTHTALNLFGVVIIALQCYFWLCEGGHCAANPHPVSLSSSQKACFMISSLLVLLLIFEGVINVLYYLWFKKVRLQLSSLILEDINHKVDAMF